MDLKSVKVKQPEAYKVFQFWRNKETVSRSRQMVVRDLYSFFDGRKIWIEVVPTYDFASECIVANSWYYTINNGIELKRQDYDNKTYYTRKDCEEHAFLRAFELLEQYIIEKKIKV